MRLSREEFDVLSEMAVSKRVLSEGTLAKRTGHSLKTVRGITLALIKKKYIENGKVTGAGIGALEPYRVKRAVLTAAGFGSRMVPVTLNTPKPLVRVNGKRIIDTILDACIKADITEIYIVRGYLGEQFDQLLYKYPTVKFIENRAYDKTNNISSVFAARKHLKNAYVFEADLYLRNPAIIKKYQYASNYLGIKMDKCDDWCFTLKDGYIDYQGIGGVNCFKEVGIIYVASSDAIKIEKDIKRFYGTEEGKNRFWEYFIFNDCKENYRIGIRECKAEDVEEIDTFDELKALDSSYDV